MGKVAGSEAGSLGAGGLGDGIMPSLRAAIWVLTSDSRDWVVESVESSSFASDRVRPVGGNVDVSRILVGSSGCPCARTSALLSPVDVPSLLWLVETVVALRRPRTDELLSTVRPARC